MNSNLEIIEEYITKYQTQNRRLEKWISTQEHAMDERVTAICQDFMQVVEAFNWAENTIHERGLDQSRVSTQAIQRLLTAKAKLVEVLANYGVERISFGNERPDAERANIIGTEPDEERPEGAVLRVERDGFQRRGHILRKADVIIVSKE